MNSTENAAPDREQRLSEILLEYVDAWRAMIDAVNSHASTVDGRRQYPTMHGANGWYGWRDAPWDVGSLEVWYWSQQAPDLERVNPATPTGGGYGPSPGAGAWLEREHRVITGGAWVEQVGATEIRLIARELHR